MHSKKDIFHSYLLKNANYAGEHEMPIIKGTNEVPHNLIPFSKAYTDRNNKNIDYNSFIVFYEHDDKFERIWNKPDNYISFLKRFKGVISPDFSLYRNMPIEMQRWNCFRGKAIAHYFEENEINVIPNIRTGDKRTFDFCFDGIAKNSIVAVGTHGCIKLKEDKEYFKMGLDNIVKKLSPNTIVVYGSAPNEIFLQHKNQGVKILEFDSATNQYHQTIKAVI